nr:hypothetical protein [Tanacetum cinerariifolium]
MCGGCWSSGSGGGLWCGGGDSGGGGMMAAVVFRWWIRCGGWLKVMMVDHGVDADCGWGQGRSGGGEWWRVIHGIG